MARQSQTFSMRFFDRTLTRHLLHDSSRRAIGLSLCSEPNNTKHSQETYVHDPGGIRTRNPSKRAAADLHF